MSSTNNENRRSYFVTTAGRKLIIEKMHLCSWLFHDEKECLEVGLQIRPQYGPTPLMGKC